MAYCRFSDGNVYMFPTMDGKIECMACRLLPQREEDLHPCIQFATRLEAMEHLRAHLRAGHTIPDRTFDRLKYETEALEE